MVFDGILFAVIVGFIRGGNFKRFGDLRFKMGWIFPLLLLIQVGIFYFQNKVELIGQYSNLSFMAVYVVGLVFLWLNRDHPHFTIIFIGVLLNFVVMALNGGRMPVSMDAASVIDPAYMEATKNALYAKHTLVTESTLLPYLGDIIPLSAPYPREQAISIGDVVMNIGAFLFIQSIMVGKKDKLTTNAA
ncbi:DUF5317 domain-containing protein [Bacillus salacetis]|uniref:DUF5317 domain-containing protein n=1 Tax=Bacillus salacetis TaxID=2315464 RepID=UPI003BA0EA28